MNVPSDSPQALTVFAFSSFSWKTWKQKLLHCPNLVPMPSRALLSLEATIYLESGCCWAV